MREKVIYRVANGATLFAIEEVVTERIAAGWVLQGGIMSNSVGFYQAMTHTSNSPPKVGADADLPPAPKWNPTRPGIQESIWSPPTSEGQ